MKSVQIIYVFSIFLLYVRSQHVVCRKGKLSKTVTIDATEKYVFKTHKGKYLPFTSCSVNYELGHSCLAMKFFCKKSYLPNRDKKNCNKGDKIIITSNGKTKKYCGRKKPKVMSWRNIRVTYQTGNSRKKRTYSSDLHRWFLGTLVDPSVGSSCRISCVRSTTTTTSTSTSTTKVSLSTPLSSSSTTTITLSTTNTSTPLPSTTTNTSTPLPSTSTNTSTPLPSSSTNTSTPLPSTSTTTTTTTTTTTSANTSSTTELPRYVVAAYPEDPVSCPEITERRLLKESMRAGGSRLTDDEPEIMNQPTLGRTPKLGEFYSFPSESLLTGYSLWPPEEMESKKYVNVKPWQSTALVLDETQDQKFNRLQVDASVSCSLLGGLIKASGSARYIKAKTDVEDMSTVTFSYKSRSRTETLAPGMSSPMCEQLQGRPLDTATHVVTSVTYGGDAHFKFSKRVEKGETKKSLDGRVRVKVSFFFFSVSTTINFGEHTSSGYSQEGIDVELYSDFIVDAQPTTLNESLQVYKKISENFGNKESVYKHSVPMSFELAPIEMFCKRAKTRSSSGSANIDDTILKEAAGVQQKFDSSLSEVNNLMGSGAAEENYEINRVLTDFQSQLSSYSLNYQDNLGKNLVSARNPEDGATEEEIIQQICNYRSSPMNHEKVVAPFIAEKKREIKTINIIYEQDEVKISSYSKAEIPGGIVGNKNVFVLTMSVLPNFDQQSFANQNQPKNESSEPWFNNFATIGSMGSLMKDFEMFSQLNGYQKDFASFIKLDNSPDGSLIGVKLYVDGIVNDKFQFELLMELSPHLTVCRGDTNMKIDFINPPIREAPNTITQVLFNYTRTNGKSGQDHDAFTPSWFLADISDDNLTSVVLPDISPELSYNITVAYSTEYGTGRPSQIVTNMGKLDQMMNTPGCRIDLNIKLTNINLHSSGISSYECAKSTGGYESWIYEIGTKTCYIPDEKGPHEPTPVEGSVVGTQGCGGAPTLNDNICL